MSKVALIKDTVIGKGFVPQEFLPQGENEYYIRDKQVKALDKKWRHLTAAEVEQLRANANYSSNWDDVLVTDVFDANAIRDTKFYGLVRIGDVGCGTLSHDDLSLPIGISNSTIVSADLGNNVAVHNVNFLANYIVGDECILFNIKEMTTSSNAKFGNGVVKDGESADSRLVLTVMNEAGGREIAPFEDMIAADAYMWAKYIDDKHLQARLAELTQQTVDSKRGYYGTIGNNTIIGAGALVTQGKSFEDGVLVLGNPAKVIRKLTEEEIHSIQKSADNYVDLSKKYKY
jgi:acetyltransferase-like isoleucine patch superfamily enzyme